VFSLLGAASAAQDLGFNHFRAYAGTRSQLPCYDAIKFENGPIVYGGGA
jgi:hypothetical protein